MRRPSTLFALLFALLFAAGRPVQAQPRATENVLLVTLDGLRWQELFAGADSLLLNDERYTHERERLSGRFWAATPEERRARLMPFFWNTIANEGQLYGNRTHGSRVDVTNRMWFSYPGYNEILTGRADDARIDSNDKTPNPNVTVLETVNRAPGFEGRVAAFGSWDVFPFIVNEERSGVPVNAGFEAAGGDLTERERFLNELQAQVPSPWSSVRLDAFTHGYAMEHLRKHRPRLLYVAYGETDDFAHDGRYDHYLEAAYRTDTFIADLWDWIQTDPGYRDKTTLVVTTDHGRGEGDDWMSHGTKIAGADAIWLAVLGPDAAPLGEVKADGRLYQNQVAATVAALLGLDLPTAQSAGDAIPTALTR